MTRRAAAHRRRARRRGPRRGRAARGSRVAAPAGADARSRPPGRARGDAAGGAAARSRADRGGSRPVGLDHARPRRQARHRPSPRSARRATTRSRSSCPASRIPASAAAIIGKTAQLELFDLQANLVAPSIDARTRQPIATAEALRPARGPAGARGEGRARHVLRLPDEGQEARRRAGEQRSRRRSRSGTASCPPGTSSSPCHPRPWSSAAGSARRAAPASAS